MMLKSYNLPIICLLIACTPKENVSMFIFVKLRAYFSDILDLSENLSEILKVNVGLT